MSARQRTTTLTISTSSVVVERKWLVVEWMYKMIHGKKSRHESFKKIIHAVLSLLLRLVLGGRVGKNSFVRDGERQVRVCVFCE